MPSGPRTTAKADAGRRLASARRRAGLTQKQLAELVDVSVNSVKAWEQGRADPYRRVAELGRVLDIDATWLFDGMTEEGPGSIGKPPPRPDDPEFSLRSAWRDDDHGRTHLSPDELAQLEQRIMQRIEAVFEAFELRLKNLEERAELKR
jgi:HTH-type transcriptional regulator, cell division transcriptional repressor